MLSIISSLNAITLIVQCAVSHIFHITGADVQLVCNFTLGLPFNIRLLHREIKCLTGLCHAGNPVMHYLFGVMDMKWVDEIRHRCKYV